MSFAKPGGNYIGVHDKRHTANLYNPGLHPRPEINNPVWHASLRNTAQDRTLSDATWADMGQSFAEDMGFADHPWVAVRHGDDPVHLVEV